MGSHDLAHNGPGGSVGNGTAGGASSYNRDASAKRSSDARTSLPGEDFDAIPEPDRVSQGFPHTEIVPVITSAEDPANYFSSLLEPGGMESTKRQEVDNHMASARTAKAMDHALPSLRVVLSDPLTGDLMEDATILPCGHSFGSGGIHRVLESNSCITCGVQVSREVLAPNYALQAAVQAYKREEENSKPRKRPSERFVQDQFATDQTTSEAVRLRLVQFPFSVGDRVMIKGNKRTPDRFVSREAVITAQCLNGWYVVRTSDNGETVKLQYRSLMKVGGPQ